MLPIFVLHWSVGNEMTCDVVVRVRSHSCGVRIVRKDTDNFGVGVICDKRSSLSSCESGHGNAFVSSCGSATDDIIHLTSYVREYALTYSSGFNASSD